MTSNFICFDIGNVLCRVDFDNFLDALSKHRNITRAEAWYFLGRMQKLHDLGMTTLRDELHDHFKINSEIVINELLEHWNGSVQREGQMFGLLDDLMDNGFKVALLSNIGFEHAEYLNKVCSSFTAWKNAVHFFSCDVGARKPSTLYYQSFLMQCPKFKGALYIDDRQENLDTGKDFGFKTVNFSLDDSRGKNEQVTQQNISTAVKQLKNLILKDK
jgi:FMN phosphatase YigB (HAD superfamily)